MKLTWYVNNLILEKYGTLWDTLIGAKQNLKIVVTEIVSCPTFFTKVIPFFFICEETCKHLGHEVRN